MKKRYTEEQIVGFLREADAGLPVKELCRKHGFSHPRDPQGQPIDADLFHHRREAPYRGDGRVDVQPFDPQGFLLPVRGLDAHTEDLRLQAPRRQTDFFNLDGASQRIGGQLLGLCPHQPRAQTPDQRNQKQPNDCN